MKFSRLLIAMKFSPRDQPCENGWWPEKTSLFCTDTFHSPAVVNCGLTSNRSSTDILLQMYVMQKKPVHVYCYISLYCHVSGVPWLIITGSGLDNWILFTLLLQLQPIITAHNQRLLETRSVPYWTTSVFSSAWLTSFWFTCRSLLQLPLSAG
jgi:hypothetical protein